MKNLLKHLITLVLFNGIALMGYSQYNNAFRFKITGNGYSDETVIRLVNGATQNFDGMYDAWKLFSPNTNVPSIYTQVAAGQELSINSLPEFTEDKSITIYTNIPANGTYVLDFEEIYALTSNYKISISDISSSTDFRLLGDTALNFIFNIQQNSPSFTFNLSTPLTSSVTNETCFGMSDGVLIIDNTGNTDWDVQILDNGNNPILSSTSTSSSFNCNNLAPGNYRAVVTSKGIIDELTFNVTPAVQIVADFNLENDTIYLSEGGFASFINNSQNATNYSWNFGDGGSSIDENPDYNYSTIGNYNVSLTAATTNCNAQASKQLVILATPAVVTSVAQINENETGLSNLGNGKYQLTWDDYSTKQIKVYDLKGSLIVEDIASNSTYNLSLANSPSGIYVLTVINENGQSIQEKLFR